MMGSSSLWVCASPPRLDYGSLVKRLYSKTNLGINTNSGFMSRPSPVCVTTCTSVGLVEMSETLTEVIVMWCRQMLDDLGITWAPAVNGI